MPRLTLFWTHYGNPQTQSSTQQKKYFVFMMILKNKLPGCHISEALSRPPLIWYCLVDCHTHSVVPVSTLTKKSDLFVPILTHCCVKVNFDTHLCLLLVFYCVGFSLTHICVLNVDVWLYTGVCLVCLFSQFIWYLSDTHMCAVFN